jgi:hypothetical protein
LSAASRATAWIRPLAAPYLRGYKPRAERSGSLRGYWFFHPGFKLGGKRKTKASGPPRSTEAAGFFVGYLLSSSGYEFLEPLLPECLVFAFVRPPTGALHHRLVVEADSLVRKTFAYIRWLTHRPPRFVFAEEQSAAMVRHCSMRDWRPAGRRHFSRNFFIETLAWLVRSGLVRKLLEEPVVRER